MTNKPKLQICIKSQKVVNTKNMDCVNMNDQNQNDMKKRPLSNADDTTFDSGDDWSYYDESESYISEDDYGDFDMHTNLITMSSAKPTAGFARSPSLLSFNEIKLLRDQTSEAQSMKLPRSISTPTDMFRNVVNISQTESAQPQHDLLSAKDGVADLSKPAEYLTEFLKSKGRDASLVPSSTLKDFFLENTDENIAAYETDVVAAFRQSNLDAIKSFHEKGKLLQSCNKFGESVVHLTCRRGSFEILQFLTAEAGVSVRVRCDSGRTPLHDACWSSRPNFELVQLLILQCPELLLITDNRGFSPLAYVPKTLWGKWRDFIKENEDILIPNLSLIR